MSLENSADSRKIRTLSKVKMYGMVPPYHTIPYLPARCGAAMGGNPWYVPRCDRI